MVDSKFMTKKLSFEEFKIAVTKLKPEDLKKYIITQINNEHEHKLEQNQNPLHYVFSVPEQNKTPSTTLLAYLFRLKEDLLKKLSDTDLQEIIDTAKANGININDTDDSGITALHNAAGANNIRSINLLLKNGADIEAKSKVGFTPLCNAVSSYPNLRAFRYLIIRGASTAVLIKHYSPPSNNMDLYLIEEAQKDNEHQAIQLVAPSRKPPIIEQFYSLLQKILGTEYWHIYRLPQIEKHLFQILSVHYKNDTVLRNNLNDFLSFLKQNIPNIIEAKKNGSFEAVIETILAPINLAEQDHRTKLMLNCSSKQLTEVIKALKVENLRYMPDSKSLSKISIIGAFATIFAIVLTLLSNTQNKDAVLDYAKTIIKSEPVLQMINNICTFAQAHHKIQGFICLALALCTVVSITAATINNIKFQDNEIGNTLELLKSTAIGGKIQF